MSNTNTKTNSVQVKPPIAEKTANPDPAGAKGWFLDLWEKSSFWIAFLAAAICIVMYYLWFSVEKIGGKIVDSFLPDVKEGFFASQKGGRSLYQELLKNVPEDQRCLVNLQPLTANMAGFMGPLDKGVFKPKTYIRNALQAGFRAFVLPISIYKDDNKKPPNWPPSDTPSIIFRNDKGEITSLNGISLQTFLEALLITLAEQGDTTQANEPILLYIIPAENGKYIPDPLTEERMYVNVMHMMAKQIEAANLGQRRLTNLGQKGAAIGGANESAILTTPLQQLQGKILFFTSFKTDLMLKSAYTSMSPRLSQFMNFLTQPISSGETTNVPGSRSLALTDVVGSKMDWVSKARSTWHATLEDDPRQCPTEKSMSEGLQKGIQSIPIPFGYGVNDGEAAKLIRMWEGFAWRIKDPDTRYFAPAPLNISQANPKMNAGTGSVRI